MTTTAAPRAAADPDLVRAALTDRFRDAPGLISVVSTRNWTGIQTDSIDAVVAEVMRLDQLGVKGIYTRVTTVSEPLPRGKRGSAADSLALIGMWSDIDYQGPGHKAENLPANEDEARRVSVAAGLPEPTTEEHSGGGIYRWWKLHHPIVIGQDIGLAEAKLLSTAFQYALGNGAAILGSEYGQGVKDLARVLRLPGTVRRKDGCEPVLCRTVTTDGPRYTLDEMFAIAAELGPKPKPRPAKRTSPAAARNTASSARSGPGPLEILGNHNAVPEILLTAGWSYDQQNNSCPICNAGECQNWHRPGRTSSDSDKSASVHKDGATVTIWSETPGLPTQEMMSGPRLFAELHHRGDQSAAAKDILRAAHCNPQATPAALALPAEMLAEVRANSEDKDAPVRPLLRSVPTQPGPGVPLVDGTSALKDEQPEPEQADDNGVRQLHPDRYDYTRFGLPTGVEAPKNYSVDHRGVWLHRTRKENGQDKPEQARITFAPVVVTRAFHDPDGQQSVELSWTDGSRIVSHTVARDVAKRGRELIRQVGSMGLPAIEADARLLERWLAEFEVTNRRHIPNEYLARNLGWQPDGTFVATVDGDVKVDVAYDEQRAPARAHTKAGTLEGWRHVMAELENYTVPRVAVAAGFASALLRPLGVTSFTLDISSRSTKGKTTCAQCGMSVWANPSEQADAMANWRTTLYAIEKRLNLTRGILTVLDETMAVDDETLVDQVLYQLPMNHGKARSGGYASMLAWETILLSTGERPALSFTTAQGAAARILGTTKAPFGDGGGDVAVRVRDGILANYGHAGPAFVERLLMDLATPDGLERLKDRHRQMRDQLKGDNDMTARRAPMVAALALAEELASQWGILPYKPMPADRWKSLFAAHNPTDNRPEMAMDVLREYIASHPWEIHPGIPDRPPVRGWIGAMKQTHDGETRVAIMTERLKTILADGGYSLDAVEGGWLDSKYLEERDKCRPKHKIPTRIDGHQTRCFIFTAAALRLDADDLEAL